MSKARELALVVAKARQEILNRETVRQCRKLYEAIMEQASKGASLGAYVINGQVETDPSEKYDFGTITNQMQLKLEMEEFENVKVFLVMDPTYDGHSMEEHALFGFSFTIPEIELPQPQQINFGF